jgi:carbon-monoxide dehydrogenase catalytic subunit
MSDKDIKNSYRRSAETMGGNKGTIASGLSTFSDYNDPALHEHLHEQIKIDYDKIEKSPSMEEVHKPEEESRCFQTT